MKKKALVFSGGGGKGGYQIGAWKALREIGWNPDIVIGTSVGALNGALIALDKYDEGEKIWENMNMARVFTRFADDPAVNDLDKEKKLNVLFRDMIVSGGADMGPLGELIDEHMDESVIRHSKIRFGMVTTKFPNITPVQLFVEDIPDGEIGDYIMASAACFPFTKAKKIGSTTYVDGGYTQNMPVQMAIDAGAAEVVIVDISGEPEQKMLTGSENVKLRYVRSSYLFNEGIKQTLTFDPELSKEYMHCGYLDTLKTFHMLDGYTYYFKKGEKYNAKDYEPLCRDMFEQIYSCMPFEKRLEKMSRQSVVDHLNKNMMDPFRTFSNVTLCCEEAASMFGIDCRSEVYTMKSISEKIIDALKQTVKKSEEEQGKTVMSRLTDTVPLLSMLEKEKLTSEIAYLLAKTDNEEALDSSRNELWIVGIAMPEIIASAVFCAAALRALN